MKSKLFPLSIGLIMLSLLLVGVVSASYPMFHYNGQRTGYVPEDGPQNNTILWKANLGEFIGAPPAVEGDRVYIGVWPDMNFASGEEYYLFCLNASTGSEVWRNPLGAGEGTVSGAAVSGDRLFVGCMDGNLYCIDTTDGSTLWNVPVDTGREGGNWYGLSCSPVVYDDMVLVTSMTDGTLHAFDPDGNEVRTYTTGNATFAYSSPAVDAAGRAYFAGNAVTDALYCIDIDTGEEIWNVTTDGQVKSSPVIDGSTVYAASANRLYALDTGDGSEVWNRSVRASWGTPAVAGGRLYLGTADGVMHCYDAQTGEEEWTFTANGKIDTSPIVANDTVYFASNTGTATIYAVDTAGNEIWRYATTNNLHSSPSVSDGVLYIGSDEGSLYAFGDGLVPTPVFPGWSGSVRLAEGETFTVTPFNNASAVYTVNRTSALGALDAAATAGNFNYTLKEETWGSILYSIGGIACNETSQDSWLFMVDGVTASVGAADYQLADGDVVTYWYGGWDSPPESAGAVVNITVSLPAPTPTPGGGGGGDDSSSSWITVTLESGTFNVTAANSGKTYTVDRRTALGALDAAGTPYTIDDSYYLEYGSLFLNSVNGRAGEGTKGWMYQVNGESPGAGANAYAVTNGDEVVFFWSEGMSSTPATSPDVISIRVVIPASSGDSGSSSSGDGSGVSGTTTSGSGEPGAAPSFFLGLPAGAVIELGEWGQVFSFDTGRGNTSAERVTVSGNSFIIRRNGLTVVLAARNINEQDGRATGLIESVTASIEPVTANISTMGIVTASLDLNLTGIPGDGRIEISFNETPDPGAASAFHLATTENDEEIVSIAYTMTVTRTNLENGEDIAGAVIRMTVSPTWVEEHGGVDAVRIARSAEDGTYEILDTRLAGTNGNGNLIFEGISPGGLSVFGLLAVTAAPAVQDTPAITATAAVSDTPAATGASPSLSSPLIVVGVGAALIIGAAYLFIERRRKQ
jgi:outer membrane protein assembly factor BamB